VLATFLGCHVARYTRASLIDTLGREFILAAQARGASRARVLWHHALPASLHTTIALFGLVVPFLVAGSVLVEWVFNWPGMGQLLVGALKRKDYPVACAAVVVVSWVSILGNLLADAVAVSLDPRVEE
jgi:peptide/nickel transport system permease protein